MSAGDTPARPRARINAKDEAEFERWRKLVELVEDKKRRGDVGGRESLVRIQHSERSETRPEAK
jgi:hypothetical protein